MEVSESDWISKAIDNIDRYLNRGGDLQGDEPQLLGGTDLLNTIGVAMGFNVRDPRDWTDDELQRALNNNLVFFDGDARRAIDVIADQIRYCCSGDDKNFVTVLPIELYWNGKLYELPLFRVHRYKTSKKYYVDNIGRSYSSVDDWFNNNKLPPCKMAYPRDLILQLRPGYNYSRVLTDDTPSARLSAHIVGGVDVATSVVGIGSSVGLMFLTGGIAAPLAVGGLVTAVWGTGRTGYQLYDRAAHGENINPFSNTESRMLWLGIAANVVSFGALGASMRLTSLAARGRDISSSFRILVNAMNGANVVVSGIAMVDTSIFLMSHYDELSSMDVLMHAASIAFWTKGLYNYRTAGMLIREAQNQTFMAIGRELHPDDAFQLSNVRQQFNNDAQLLREFHRASESNISIQRFSQIVIDAHMHGNIQFDGAGNLILNGGQSYPLQFLSELTQPARREYFNVITNLQPEQVELLESFRRTLGDDRRLIIGLYRVADHYNLTPRDATEQVLNFWARYSQMNMLTGPEMGIRDGNLVIGRAPPLPLPQLRGISTPMLRFVGEHLVRMDEPTSRQWASSMPVLLELQNRGMFSRCPITRIVPTGRAVLLLNENLQVSIFRLNEIEPNDCENILRAIGELPVTVTTADVPTETRRLVDRYRLRLQCQRRESVTWMRTNTSTQLHAIIDSDLLSFERDRLITFRSTVETARATPYLGDLMSFVAEMRPRNVSELVAYGEYAVTCLEAEKRALEVLLRSGELTLPPHTKKADFLRQKASEKVLRERTAMRRLWEETLELVRAEGMVGAVELGGSLSDDALVAAVREARVGFGSETSAAYHVIKHPTDPARAYVDRANACVRGAARWSATLTQDGDARILRFEGDHGAAILLERNGRVLLATFSPRTS